MFPRTNTGKEPSKEEILAELRRRKLQRKLLDYRPYPKQYDFHAMGATFRERLFMAGNQEGKTFGASHEVAFHATGLYPKWWPGRRFSKPVTIWTGAPTNEKSKGVVQKQLLGTTVASLKHPDIGTGTLPMDSIVKVTTRQAGVKDVVDEILVRHISGGISRIALLTYEMGAAKWGGEPVDVVWDDEEPSDYDIYSEGLTRTNATGG
ncbi:MAG: terminase family protein, partial [Methylomonas sp.]|nr:terminase family protein [Methylomonas sp.]